MIRLTESQYAAIGRVAVQSGTLEREVTEYLVRLGKPPKPRDPISTQLGHLEKALSSHPTASLAKSEFDFVTTALKGLIEKRNALVHGVWSTTTNAPLLSEETLVQSRSSVVVRALEIAAVAEQIRFARKLLLRLCHEHCQVAAGTKKCPRGTSATLRRQFGKAARTI